MDMWVDPLPLHTTSHALHATHHTTTVTNVGWMIQYYRGGRWASSRLVNGLLVSGIVETAERWWAWAAE